MRQTNNRKPQCDKQEHPGLLVMGMIDHIFVYMMLDVVMIHYRLYKCLTPVTFDYTRTLVYCQGQLRVLKSHVFAMRFT